MGVHQLELHEGTKCGKRTRRAKVRERNTIDGLPILVSYRADRPYPSNSPARKLNSTVAQSLVQKARQTVQLRPYSCAQNNFFELIYPLSMA